jgi:toxin-antitoxin system PIN domain toxin
MILPDVNLLLYAHRKDYPEHAAYAEWLHRTATGPEPFALSELICSAFVRIVTNPRAFDPITPIGEALEFIRRLRTRSNCVVLRPGARNWEIFTRLCEGTKAGGKLVADAYHAALAIEHGCEWVTNDGDFARFAELRWRHPLQNER